MTTLTNIRLRELQRIAEDRATDLALPFAEIQDARDTAAALAELHEFRVKLAKMVRGDEAAT